MNKTVKSIVVLSSIGIILALVLGGVNILTAPVIAEAERIKTVEALSEVYTAAESFDKVDISKVNGLPDTVTEIYRANDGGYVVKLTTTGYSSGLVILCGISPEGEVTRAISIASSETLGYEKTYGDTLKGATSSTIDGVDTVSRATKTTLAYRNAVRDALKTAALLSES